MRPKERRDSGQNDLFRARLDQIIDMNHALARLGRAIDWRFLEERFGAAYTDAPGPGSLTHPQLRPFREEVAISMEVPLEYRIKPASDDQWRARSNYNVVDSKFKRLQTEPR